MNTDSHSKANLFYTVNHTRYLDAYKLNGKITELL